MIEMVNEEFDMFLQDVKEASFVFGSYLDETDYEDEYCHNDIHEAMHILEEKIKDYLHNNYPNKFIVSSGWCVHVMTPDRARQSRITESTIERCLVE